MFWEQSVVAGVRWSHRFAPDFAPLPRRCAGRRLLEMLVGRGGGRQAGPTIFGENELQRHYRLRLGGESPGQVKHGKLELGEKRVAIQLAWAEGA